MIMQFRLRVSQKCVEVKDFQAQSMCYQLPKWPLDADNKECYAISLNRFIFWSIVKNLFSSKGQADQK